MTDLYDAILATRKNLASRQPRGYINMPAVLEQARAFLYGAHQGALGSIDNGAPFVSAVNLVAASDGRVLLMVSRLAEHSQNLAMNPACSILLSAAGAPDIQQGPRLTLVGDVVKVSTEQAQRYLDLFPHTEKYLDLDFYFLALNPRRARWIAGFGRAVWLEGKDLCTPPPWGEQEGTSMIEHMNNAHVDALVAYLALSGRPPADSLSMAALDPWGLWLLADGEPVRVPFEVPAMTPEAVRNTLIELKEISPHHP